MSWNSVSPFLWLPFMSSKSWRLMFSKMIPKELEAGCLLVYFSRIRDSGGDFSMLLQNLEEMVTHHPMIDLQWPCSPIVPSGMCLPLSQESHSSLVTEEQEFLSITEPMLSLLQDLVSNSNSEDKAFGYWGLCWISHAISNTFQLFLENKVHFREKYWPYPLKQSTRMGVRDLNSDVSVSLGAKNLLFIFPVSLIE